MNTITIKEKLHGYIENSDDKLLKLLFALAKEYNSDVDYEFNSEEMQVFEQRRWDRLNGKSKTYTWEEAKAAITGKSVL